MVMCGRGCVDEGVLMVMWRWCCVDDGVFDDVVWMALCRWCCVDGAPSAAPAAPNEADVLQVPRLLRKSRRCPRDPGRRQTSVDLYAGAPSAAPATHKQAAPKGRRLSPAGPATQSEDNEVAVLQVLRQPGGDGVVMMLC